MSKGRGDLFKTAMQVLAVLCLVVIFSMVLHKAFHDISRLAQLHSGGDFWVALGRQLLRNLGGG